MADHWTLDELCDANRDVYALLRAFNATGDLEDETVQSVLRNADPRLLVRLLMGVARGCEARLAALTGCDTDEEIRARVDARFAELQAAAVADPGWWLDGEPGDPPG